jgi:hypothetical protein
VPNDFVIATSSWFVGSEEQRAVIWNLEAVELQPHAAVGEVFNETGTFFARPTQDRCYASARVSGRARGSGSALALAQSECECDSDRKQNAHCKHQRDNNIGT